MGIKKKHNNSKLCIQITLKDSASFEKFFKSHFQQLVNFSYCYVEDVSISENIVQDVFFQIWKRRDKLGPDVKLNYYVYRAVKNNSLKYIRNRKVVNNRAADVYHLNNPGKNPEEKAGEAEIIDSLMNAIKKLPKKRQVIFYMSKFENLKYSEIAEILNISIKTVENQMGLALKFLRKHLL